MINIYSILNDAIQASEIDDIITLLDFLSANDNVEIANNSADPYQHYLISEILDDMLMTFKTDEIMIKLIAVSLKKQYLEKESIYDYVQHLKYLINSKKIKTQEDIDYIDKVIDDIQNTYLQPTKFEEHFDSFTERLKKIDQQPKKINESEETKKWPLEKIYEDLLTNSKITTLLNQLGFNETIKEIIFIIENSDGISKEKKEKTIAILNSITSPRELIKYLTNSMLNSSSNLGMSRGKPEYNRHRHF